VDRRTRMDKMEMRQFLILLRLEILPLGLTPRGQSLNPGAIKILRTLTIVSFCTEAVNLKFGTFLEERVH
jgi:hypothetical protein